MKKVAYIKPEANLVSFSPVDIICVSVVGTLADFLKEGIAEDYGRQKANIYDNV